jgi:hypothetical protein
MKLNLVFASPKDAVTVVIDGSTITLETHEKAAHVPVEAPPVEWVTQTVAATPKRRGRQPKTTDLYRFDDWYQHYPRKAARGQAEKAWCSLNPSDELIDTMIAAIKSQDYSGKEPGFIPHPATWLNGKRWLDEAGTAQQEKPLPYAGKPWAAFIRTGNLPEVLNLMAQVGIEDAEGIESRLADGETVEEVCDWLWSFRNAES